MWWLTDDGSLRDTISGVASGAGGPVPLATRSAETGPNSAGGSHPYDVYDPATCRVTRSTRYPRSRTARTFVR